MPPAQIDAIEIIQKNRLEEFASTAYNTGQLFLAAMSIFQNFC